MKARIKRAYIVYSITNTVTGKRYIGTTSRRHKRFSEHLLLLSRGEHHSVKLQSSYSKHGKEVFILEVLEQGVPSRLVEEREAKWIALFDTFANGYNMTEGGGLGGGKFIPCVWNNVQYESIAEAARANGIAEQTMRRRISLGYTCEADMSYTGSRDKQVEWNGIIYQSVGAAAKACGISEGAMSTRLSNGYKSDSDMNKPYIYAASKPVTWNGINYPTITEAAKASGISQSAMALRIENGYTCDGEVPLTYSERECTWNGITYPSIHAAARALGLTYRAVIHRLNKGNTCDSDVPKRIGGIRSKSA